MNLYLILVLSFTTLLAKSLSSPNEKYEICNKKLQSSIGVDIGYPFYDGSTRPDYCGHPGFQLDCSHDPPLITITNQIYHVHKINFNYHNITVYKNDSWGGSCPDSLTNTTIDFNKFNFSSYDQNITFFYDCDQSNDLSSLPLTTTCDLGGYGSLSGYYLTKDMLNEHEGLNLVKNCKVNLFLPILQSFVDIIDVNPKLETLKDAFEAGFELGWMAENDACSSCMRSGGECGHKWDSNKFVCHCADGEFDLQCRVNSSNPGHHQLTIPVTASIAAVVGIVVLGFVIFCYKYTLQKCKPIPQNQNVEDYLKNYASLIPKRCTYTDIKKITKSFSEKLGEGGYGTVFKGSLHDGRLVAVKVWKQSKGDGQEFLNEVISISRASHVNVVPLLGFCYEGHKTALIYEFMPNGSLEKFIHGRNFNENNQLLSTEKLFEIAVGIARGLEYLHRGCNTRIVHFDIKPHNILLDAEFTPKISDFGLAKSLKQKESIISMSGARGTAGYIAPEVILRSFGGVSHKSDVYSFGMMTLEMVGCMKGVNENVIDSSEMYFPQWIYKQLEQDATLDNERILIEKEKELERKMILVGLWCIQTNPGSRPAMTRVVEMLEGKLELLEVPPVPSLASPPRQQQPSEDDSSSLIL